MLEGACFFHSGLLAKSIADLLSINNAIGLQTFIFKEKERLEELKKERMINNKRIEKKNPSQVQSHLPIIQQSKLLTYIKIKKIKKR